jgi:hypothetical protein
VSRFVSAPIVPEGDDFVTPATGHEPPIPRAFRWGDRRLVIAGLLGRRRSTKNDRGDTYLKRHWFELRTDDGARIEVYFDREARRRSSRWWLYAIEEN